MLSSFSHILAPTNYLQLPLLSTDPAAANNLLLFLHLQSITALQSSSSRKHRKVKHGRHSHKRSKNTDSIVYDGGNSGSYSNPKDYAPKEEEYQIDIPSEDDHQHRSAVYSCVQYHGCSWAQLYCHVCGCVFSCEQLYAVQLLLHARASMCNST
jgi:hypothetical protein